MKGNPSSVKGPDRVMEAQCPSFCRHMSSTDVPSIQKAEEPLHAEEDFSVALGGPELVLKLGSYLGFGLRA